MNNHQRVADRPSRALIAVALIAALASRPPPRRSRCSARTASRPSSTSSRPQFEQKTGHKVVLKFEPSTQIQKRIEAGEAFDLAVMTTALIDQEIKAGRLAADSRTIIARSGLGLSVRAGSKKPDIADRRVVQAGAARRQIDYLRHRTARAPRRSRRSSTKLGIARAGEAEVQPARHRVAGRRGRRERHRRDRRRAGQRDPAGERASSSLAPFPTEVQSYVVMTAAISSKAKEKGAAKALVDFLMSPANSGVIKAKGMER